MHQTEMNRETMHKLTTKSFGHNVLKRKASFICLSLLLSFALTCTTSETIVNVKSVFELAASDSLVQSPTQVLWERTYGGKGDDRAYYAAPTNDGGFLIVGSTTSVFEGRTVAWIIRIDSNGDMLWNKTFPEGTESDFRHVVKTDDGFVLIGNTFTSSGDPDGMIVRIDEEGNILWNITIGGPRVDSLLSGTQTLDGFVMVGLTFSYGSGGSEAWVVKTSFDGMVLWNRTYGQLGDNAARAIVPAENDSCVVAGYTNSTIGGEYEFWLFKINKEDTLLWNRTYSSSESQKALALTKTGDGYLIVGDTHLPAGAVNALMIKTDLDGNTVWQKTFGGNIFDSPSDVIRLSSGGYAITGFTFSWGKGQRDFWLFKIDDSGNVLWSCTQGRENYEEAYYVYEVAESEFVLVGWTNSIGNGLYDVYAVKIKVEPQGNDFLSNDLPYILASIVAIAVLSVGFLGLYFSKKRKVKTDSENTQKGEGFVNLSVLRRFLELFFLFQATLTEASAKSRRKLCNSSTERLFSISSCRSPR